MPETLQFLKSYREGRKVGIIMQKNFPTQLSSAYLQDENIMGMTQHAECSFEQFVTMGDITYLFLLLFGLLWPKERGSPLGVERQSPEQHSDTCRTIYLFHTETLLPYLVRGAVS